MHAAFIHSSGCITPHGAYSDGLPEHGPVPLRPSPRELGGRGVERLPEAGWIDPITRPDGLRGRRLRFGRLDRLAQLALVAVHHAVSEGLPPQAERERAGVVFGTAYGSHLANESFQLQLEQLGPGEASPAVFTYTLPSAAVGEISILLGLKGPTVTFAEGIGSGINAVTAATRLVQTGDACWMLAGAADALGPTLLAAAGTEAGTLAEGAAFFTVARHSDGALARVAGTAQGYGDAVQDTERSALDRAGVPGDALRLHRVYDGSAEFPLQSALGRSGAAAPLLGICAALVKGRSLPALFTARDPEGGINAVCLDVP